MGGRKGYGGWEGGGGAGQKDRMSSALTGAPGIATVQQRRWLPTHNPSTSKKKRDGWTGDAVWQVMLTRDGPESWLEQAASTASLRAGGLHAI